MKDWTQFAGAMQELLGWFEHSHVVHCPVCGDPEIQNTKKPENDSPLIAASHGISVGLICGRSHAWNLRVSAWRAEYPEAAQKLREGARIWKLEDVQAEIAAKRQELEGLRNKYFELREKLKVPA